MGEATRWSSPWVRLAAYLALLAVGVALAFNIGVARFSARNCSGAGFDGECDAAVLEGLLWGGATFIGLVMAFVTIEMMRARRNHVRRGVTVCLR